MTAEKMLELFDGNSMDFSTQVHLYEYQHRLCNDLEKIYFPLDCALGNMGIMIYKDPSAPTHQFVNKFYGDDAYGYVKMLSNAFGITYEDDIHFETFYDAYRRAMQATRHISELLRDLGLK